MPILRQAGAALLLSLRMGLANPRHMALAATGFLIASGTLLGLLTIPEGIARLAARTGLPDIAVVTVGTSPNEAIGGMRNAEQITLIGNLPGVARQADGSALVVPQLVVNTNMLRRDGVRTNIVLRGISPVFWEVLGHAVKTRGQPFGPGMSELMAGAGAARSFVRLDTGAQVLIRRTPWRITGEFDTGGSLWDSELWMDIGSLQDAWNARGRVSTVWVKLDSPESFEQFARALSQDPSLRGLEAIRQPDYYRFQIGFVYRYTSIAAWGVALLLGLVAVLAIANASSMALKARRREFAVLRALGFHDMALTLALFVEVALIATLCAVVVVSLGWLVLDGYGVSSATLSQAVRLQLRVGAAVAGWTIAYAIGLGLLASAWPIRRLLREPLAKSVVGL